VPFEEDRKPEIELLAKVFVAPVLDPKQSLQVRGHTPRIGDLASPPGTGTYIFTDQHGFAKGESHADLNVNVGFVQSTEIIEETQVCAFDSRDDILEYIPGGQIVSGPAEGYFVGFEEVDEIESKGPLDVRQEAVSDETGELFFAEREILGQPLQEGKFPSIRLSQIDESEASEALDRDGLRRLIEKFLTDGGQRLSLAETGQNSVVLAR
jgi:hypothetical protein